MQTFYVNVGKHPMAMTFSQTWAHRDPGGHTIHLGLMLNGAYAIVPNGLPVDREKIELCIPEGEERERALRWLEHRDQGETVKPLIRKLYFDPDDDTWRYVDTRQIVVDQEDLLAALKGTALQAAMIWFHSYHGDAQRRQLDEKARAPKQLDESILELLAEQPGWMTETLAKTLDVQPRVMMEMCKFMETAGHIVRNGKLWYRPDQLEPGAESS